MSRFGNLLAMAAFMSACLIPAASRSAEGVATNAVGAPVIDIERNGGLVVRPTAIDHYRFTVAQDGAWQFLPLTGDPKKGTMTAAMLDQWIKAIAESGLSTLRSNEKLGATDEPFMVVTIQSKDRRTRVKMPLDHAPAVSVEKRIIELVNPATKGTKE